MATSPQTEADLERILAPSAGSAEAHIPKLIAAQIAQLQSDLEKSEDKRLDDRFIFAVCGTILFDVAFLMNANTWTAPLVIGILELIVLTVVADQCRVNRVTLLLDKFTGMFNGNGSSKPIEPGKE